MNEKKQAATKKTLYELAYLNDGILIRGGLKATIATVGKWIEESLKDDPDTIYVAVPADDDAITCAENRRMMKEMSNKKTVILTEKECYCGIIELYDLVAQKAGI